MMNLLKKYEAFVDNSNSTLGTAADSDHLIPGLVEEVGKLMGKYRKYYRDNRGLPEIEFIKNINEIMWYITALTHHHGHTLEDVISLNLSKIKDTED